jgi:hypothetical protein
VYISVHKSKCWIEVSVKRHVRMYFGKSLRRNPTRKKFPLHYFVKAPSSFRKWDPENFGPPWKRFERFLRLGVLSRGINIPKDKFNSVPSTREWLTAGCLSTRYLFFLYFFLSAFRHTHSLSLSLPPDFHSFLSRRQSYNFWIYNYSARVVEG